MALAACGSCDGERAVPFKRDETTTTTTSVLGAPDAATGAAKGPLSPFAPRDGRAYGEGTRRIALLGGAIEVAEGSLRGSLDLDLDGDPQLDALLVTTDAVGTARLTTAVRTAEGYAVPAPIASLVPEAARCGIEAVLLRQFAPGFASLRAEVRCATSLAAGTAAAAGAEAPPTGAAATRTGAAPTPGPPGALPAPGPSQLAPAAANTSGARSATPASPAALTSSAAAVPSPVTQHLWILTVEALPRIVTHLDWDATLRPEAGTLVVQDVAISGADLDADGHDDVEARIALRRTLDPEPVALVLRFFDRPAGLARDPAEPEATLRGLVDAVRDKLRRDPTAALAGADRVLALHGALCREGGRPVVRFDDVGGLPCGRSRAAGRATAMRIAALARSGQVLTAISEVDRLDRDTFEVPKVDRDRVQESLAAAASKTLVWRKGPALAPTAAPRERLSAIVFLDEDTLLLRGDRPRRYAIGTGVETPADRAEDGDLRVSDVAGRLVAADVVRACDGYHVRLVPAAQVIGGLVAVASAAEPLLAAAPPPPEAHCPGALPPTLRDDRGGFRILDWTDAGLLLARGGELWRLALDDEGKARTPATIVTPSDRVPPGRAGALSADGRFFAVASGPGVAIADRTNGSVVLVPRAGSELDTPGPRNTVDLAVSPSGRRVAIEHAGHVFIAIESAPRTLAPETGTPTTTPSASGSAAGLPGVPPPSMPTPPSAAPHALPRTTPAAPGALVPAAPTAPGGPPSAARSDPPAP